MDLLEEFEMQEICPTCTVIQLPRSRHCFICDLCVDRFDHHCQWLNSCVGRRNHSYFICFVLIQAIYLFFVAASIIRLYVDILTDKHDAGENVATTCDVHGERHWAETCLIVSSDFFTENPRSIIIVYTLAALILLLSAGFAFPVL